MGLAGFQSTAKAAVHTTDATISNSRRISSSLLNHGGLAAWIAGNSVLS
jgi:hypothetical protein